MRASKDKLQQDVMNLQAMLYTKIEKLETVAAVAENMINQAIYEIEEKKWERDQVP